MRTGNVLSLPPLRAGDRTTGQDVFLEYRRHARNTWSGSARHPGACYSSATVLLSICYHIGLPHCRLLPSCYSFAIELLLLPFCAPSPRHVSDVYIAAPQGYPFRIPVIFVRHASEINRSPPCARVMPCLTAWPTPHGHTVNCAPVHRYAGSFLPEIRP